MHPSEDDCDSYHGSSAPQCRNDFPEPEELWKFTFATMLCCFLRSVVDSLVFDELVAWCYWCRFVAHVLDQRAGCSQFAMEMKSSEEIVELTLELYLYIDL
jgi:hypothetical protein